MYVCMILKCLILVVATKLSCRADIIGVRCSRLETAAASPSDLVTSHLSLSLSLSLSPASDELCLIFNFHPVLSRLVITVRVHLQFHRLSGLETETDRVFV